MACSSKPEVWKELINLAYYSMFASRVRVGHCLVTENGPTRVKMVSRVNDTGIYSPITADGYLVVDGVQTSCYSSVENHQLQHNFFTFLRSIYESVKGLFDQFGAKTWHWNAGEEELELSPLLRFILEISDKILEID